MIDLRDVLQRAAWVWAAVIAGIALFTFREVNADARWLVGVLTVLGIAAAVGASIQLRHHHDRIAGLLLLASMVAPTYTAYAVAFPALLLGLVLLVTPGSILARTNSR